jgi:threonine/homoserine/homoserine lactone efflux protein
MIPALQLFIFAGLFSPGPNVVLLIASGARFGMRATLPHLFGVVIGVGVIGGIVGLGLGGLLTAVPALEFGLLLIAVGWILWMAWGLWKSSVARVDDALRPMTFIEAVLFQCVNPKIWAVAVAATAYLIGSAPMRQALEIGISMSVINLFVCFFWTSFGHLLSGVLSGQHARKVFFRVMSGLLALSAILLVVK